jgi:hypothetical protein
MKHYLPTMHIFVVTVIVIFLDRLIGISDFLTRKSFEIAPTTFPVIK